MTIGKLLLCGAVAAMAIAMSSAPSEAAKRRAASQACMGPGGCSHSCKGGSCLMNACGFDGKWYPSVLPPACVLPFCPKKC